MKLDTTKNNLHIGIDIGGTKIAAGIVDSTGKILSQIRFPTQAELGPDKVMQNLISQLKKMIAKEKLIINKLSSIGAGVPGDVNIETGEVILAPNLGWRNIQLGDKLKGAFPGVDVFIDYDTNAAALGEYFSTENADIDNLFFITVSTGVGSGLILNNQLYRGKNNSAGEIGHTVVEPGGVQCNCGKRGCLEMYTSGPAVARISEERIRAGRDSSLEKYLIENDHLTGEQVSRAAIGGDRLACEIIEEAADYLGIALANVISLINPDVIVIGGGVARTGPLLIDRIIKTARENCYPSAREKLVIRVTELWEQAALIGASQLFKTMR